MLLAALTLLLPQSAQAAWPDDISLSALAEKGIEAEDHTDGRLTLRVTNNMDSYEALALCKEHQLNLVSVAPRRETLEELFVRTVGEAQDRSNA